jgi:hypothetical protein
VTCTLAKTRRGEVAEWLKAMALNADQRFGRRRFSS